MYFLLYNLTRILTIIIPIRSNPFIIQSDSFKSILTKHLLFIPQKVKSCSGKQRRNSFSACKRITFYFLVFAKLGVKAVFMDFHAFFWIIPISTEKKIPPARYIIA